MYAIQEISQTTIEETRQDLSVETRRLLSLGDKAQWHFRVLGQAPMPQAPVRLKNWLVVPAMQDSSIIPARSLERIQGIYAAGIRPQGFVLVHEAPMALPAPQEAITKTQPEHLDLSKPQVTATPGSTNTDFLKLGGAVLAGVGTVLSSIFRVLGSVLLPALAIGLLALDPILIAVTEEGYWIEIDRWTVNPS